MSGPPNPLPQYGFGPELTFDALVEDNPFLFRVYTPRNRDSFQEEALCPNAEVANIFEPYFLARKFEGESAGREKRHGDDSARENVPSYSTPGSTSVFSYDDIAKHMSYAQRATSPYISASFSFAWAVWEATRRYKDGVKHDVAIAVIDGRELAAERSKGKGEESSDVGRNEDGSGDTDRRSGNQWGRACTVVEVLKRRATEERHPDHWRWYKFGLESQSVLVYGAIPRKAVLASVPLREVLEKLPAYYRHLDGEAETGDKRSDGKLKKPKPSPLASLAWDPSSRSSSYNGSVSYSRPLSFSLSSYSSPSPSRPHSRSGSPSRSPSPFTTFSSDLPLSISAPQSESLQSLSRPHTPPCFSRSETAFSIPLSYSGSRTQSRSRSRPSSFRHFCRSMSSNFLHLAGPMRMKEATTGSVRLAMAFLGDWVRERVLAEYDDHSDTKRGGTGDCNIVKSYDTTAALSTFAFLIAQWPAPWWAREQGEMWEAIWGVVGVVLEGVRVGLGRCKEQTPRLKTEDANVEEKPVEETDVNEDVTQTGEESDEGKRKIKPEQQIVVAESLERTPLLQVKRTEETSSTSELLDEMQVKKLQGLVEELEHVVLAVRGYEAALARVMSRRRGWSHVQNDGCSATTPYSSQPGQQRMHKSEIVCARASPSLLVTSNMIDPFGINFDKKEEALPDFPKKSLSRLEEVTGPSVAVAPVLAVSKPDSPAVLDTEFAPSPQPPHQIMTRPHSIAETVTCIVTGVLVGAFVTLCMINSQRRALLQLT